MKRVISSVFLYTMMLFGIFFMISGFYLLSKNEQDIYRELLPKTGIYRIEIYPDRSFIVSEVSVKKIDGRIFFVTEKGNFPSYQIRSVNGIDINSQVIKKLSENGTFGIILSAAGGFLIMLFLVLKDFV